MKVLGRMDVVGRMKVVGVGEGSGEHAAMDMTHTEDE